MARQIEFHVDRLVSRLNILEQVQLPYAGSQAMRRLGYQLKQDLAQEMRNVLQNPIPWTTSSPKWDAKGLTLEIRIDNKASKGYAPQEYLEPVTTQGAALGGSKPRLKTGLQKFLEKRNYIRPSDTVLSWYPLPPVPQTQYGNAQPGFVKAVVQALSSGTGRLVTPRAKYSGGGKTRYMVVPPKGMQRSNTTLAPGVYRIQARQRPERLFAIVERDLQAPVRFDFQGTVERRSLLLLPGLLNQELQRALR